MRVETLLPLGKLDPGLRAAETPLDLGRVVEDARLVESLSVVREKSSTGSFRLKTCWRRSPALSRLPRHSPSATAS
jgi:hypothetical protein